MLNFNGLSRAFPWQGQPPRLKIQQPTAVFLLGSAAGASLLVYLWAFVGPYHLFEWYDHPRLGLYTLAQKNPLAQWWLVSAFLLQGLLYWLGWRLALQVEGRAAWLIVLGATLSFTVVLLFLYPFDAVDIFENIMHGRILAVYGANPFREVARRFAGDPFYPYLVWRNTPSAYGPIWEALAGGLVRLAGNDTVANVLAFKLLNALFLALCIGLVAVILRRIAPERVLAGVVLLAWNPVVLYETIGNGHNDIAMAAWLLAAAWAVIERRYTLAVLALLVGTLIKFIPLLLLPVVGLIALRQLTRPAARLRFVVVTGLAALGLVAVAYGPFWSGWETLGLARRATLFTASLPATVYAWLRLKLDLQQVGWSINLVAAGLTGLFVLTQAWWAGRENSRLNFARAAFNILTFYLLVTCPWFQQWYTIWPLALAALLPPGHAPRLAVLFGFATILSKHFIVGPWLFWPPRPPQIQLELIFGPAVMMVPWLYALVALWQTRQTRKKEMLKQPTMKKQLPSNALLVIAKRPAPGQTKTRLSPPLSPAHAAALYECFLRDTIELVGRVPGVRPAIAYLPAAEAAYFAKLAPDFELILQEGEELGARLDNALTRYLRLGYERVVIMNSDSPTLPVACLTAAFEELADHDVVLGLCDDGGYYLIGLKQPAPRLLREVKMSTATVAADTLALAAAEGLRVKLLPTWYDIDNAAALDRLIDELTGPGNGQARHTREFFSANGNLSAQGSNFVGQT